jgi:hypothetical protein
VFASSNEWPNGLGMHVGSFIAPQGNLSIGLSKTRTCPDWQPDMSGNRLRNPALELDNSGSGHLNRDRAEWLDMSGLGARHVWETSLKPREGARYVRPGT